MGVSSEKFGPGSDEGWTWDPSLYAGSAGYYAVGRAAYPAQLAAALTDALVLDGCLTSAAGQGH